MFAIPDPEIQPILNPRRHASNSYAIRLGTGINVRSDKGISDSQFSILDEASREGSSDDYESEDETSDEENEDE
jgi:hypothetical protein